MFMRTTFSHALPSILGALVLALTTQSGLAVPIITNVLETGGDNDVDDTVPAKWTGVSWSNHQAGEPVLGLAAGASYTVGLFRVAAPCYVDRAHAYTN